MKTALFPGSFDPFTLGHKDILISALKLFDKVVVAIGHNSAKKGLLDIEQRKDIIHKSIKDLDSNKVDVVQFPGLTIDFCQKHNIDYIVRGIRTTADFEFETNIAQANQRLNKNVLTIFIPATGDNTFVSSSIVRDVATHQGDSSIFMAENVNLEDYLK